MTHVDLIEKLLRYSIIIVALYSPTYGVYWNRYDPHERRTPAKNVKSA